MGFKWMLWNIWDNIVAFFSGNNSKGLDDKDVSQIHRVHKTMTENYNVPGHEPRSNSPLYNQTHDDLINTKDTPCYICGVSKSTLGNPTNLYGSTQMETHHQYCEWSLANGVDWNTMKTLHPDFPNWSAVVPGDTTTYFNFVDHPYNMLVLCDVHHRLKNHGIHRVEEPIWKAQKFISKDFNFIPDSFAKAPHDPKDFVDDLS